ncbi:deoxyribose-phosphate aldolase-like isoform X2 [Styela clava]
MKDAVATGFPAGQTPLETNLIEIQRAVESGASEIDIVIYRTKALHGDWKGLLSKRGWYANVLIFYSFIFK